MMKKAASLCLNERAIESAEVSVHSRLWTQSCSVSAYHLNQRRDQTRRENQFLRWLFLLCEEEEVEVEEEDEQEM